MSNYFIIHGSLGNPNENWFPWLEKQLEEQGKEVIVPHFPGNQYQNYTNWSKILEQYLAIGLINEETIFIGHSLGPVFIIRFLIEHEIKVKGIISVSGFNALLGMDLDEINKTFLIEDIRLEKIVNYTKFRYCFYSENDPYVPLNELEKFALQTKAETCIIKEGGHFNTSAGYTNFPKVLEVIQEAEEHDMSIRNNGIL